MFPTITEELKTKNAESRIYLKYSKIHRMVHILNISQCIKYLSSSTMKKLVHSLFDIEEGQITNHWGLPEGIFHKIGYIHKKLKIQRPNANHL